VDTTVDRPTSGSWVGWIMLAFTTIVLTFAIDAFVLWSFSGTCGHSSDASTVWHGRVALLVVLVVMAAPWFALVARARRRTPGAVMALLGVLPALAFVIHGFAPGAWVGTFCF
jgi:hypothetical protein